MLQIVLLSVVSPVLVLMLLYLFDAPLRKRQRQAKREVAGMRELVAERETEGETSRKGTAAESVDGQVEGRR